MTAIARRVVVYGLAMFGLATGVMAWLFWREQDL